MVRPPRPLDEELVRVLLYFIGFSGIWLVFALYFQSGLGYSPLQSGLAVTPFALGSAASAAVAGRLVERFGRRLTVVGLTCVVLGLAAAAIVLLPLLLAGIGGGATISPNITLTLECVPVRMAGAAGGALQTGQRIGAAVGTAVLATVFYAIVSGGRYPDAVAAALLAAAGFSCIALGAALLELRARRHRQRIRDRERRDAEPDPAEHAPVHAHHP